MKKQNQPETKTRCEDTTFFSLEEHKTPSKLFLLPFTDARYDIIPRTSHNQFFSLHSSIEELYEKLFDTVALSVKECLLSMYNVQIDEKTIHPSTICFDEHLATNKFDKHHAKKLGIQYTESTFQNICDRLLHKIPEDMNTLYELLHMIAMKLDILICLWYQPKKPHEGYWLYVYPRKGIVKSKKHEYIVKNVDRPVFIYLNFQNKPIEIRAIKPKSSYFKLILSQLKVDLHLIEEKQTNVDTYWKQMANNKQSEMNPTNTSASPQFVSAKSSLTPNKKDVKHRHTSPTLPFVSAKSTWTPSPETMHRQKIELDFDIKMTRKRISAQKKIHDLQKRIDNLIENEKQTTKDIETRHDDLMKTNRNLKKKMDTDLEKTKKELQESKKELHRIHEQQRKSIREQYTYEDLEKDALKRLQETYKIQNELEYELSVLLKKKQDTNVELNTLLENKNTVEHHKRNSKPSPRSKKKQTISKPAKRRPRVDPVLANTGLTGTYWDYKNTKRSTKRREM